MPTGQKIIATYPPYLSSILEEVMRLENGTSYPGS
jgi:hypothetical protein